MRRGYIRGLLLTVLVLCVAEWVWSYVYLMWAGFKRGTTAWYMHSHQGILDFRIIDNRWSEGWHSSVTLANAKVTEELIAASQQYFLGFVMVRQSGALVVGVPFWFLTLVALGIFWWVWRSTHRWTGGPALPEEVKSTADAKPRQPPA